VAMKKEHTFSAEELEKLIKVRKQAEKACSGIMLPTSVYRLFGSIDAIETVINLENDQ